MNYNYLITINSNELTHFENLDVGDFFVDLEDTLWLKVDHTDAFNVDKKKLFSYAQIAPNDLIYLAKPPIGFYD